MLNERELEILNIIINYIDENGYAPSVREIGEKIGLKSTSSVHAYLKILEVKGYIKRKENYPRALNVLKERKVEKYNC